VKQEERRIFVFPSTEHDTEEQYNAAALTAKAAFERTSGQKLVQWSYDPLCGGVNPDRPGQYLGGYVGSWL